MGVVEHSALSESCSMHQPFFFFSHVCRVNVLTGDKEVISLVVREHPGVFGRSQEHKRPTDVSLDRSTGDGGVYKHLWTGTRPVVRCLTPIS